MNSREQSGYENEPEERFEPLPEDLGCHLYHVERTDCETELAYYSKQLDRGGCRRVVEFGCGTGRIAEYLHGHGCNVIGLDLSHAALVFSQESRKVPVIETDMCRVGLTGPFDAVIIPCNTLNLLPDRVDIGACLAEAKRLLSPTGLLICQLYTVDEQLAARAGDRIFQFSLIDLPEGGKLLKETIRRYTPGDDSLELEERYKLRYLPNPADNRNFRQILNLRCFTPSAWLELIERHGFTVTRLHGDFDGQPFLENHSSRMMVIARPAALVIEPSV